MPHAKREVHRAVSKANEGLGGGYDPVPESVGAAASLGELAASLEITGDAAEAIGRLRPPVEKVVLRALQAAAEEGRPAVISWRHGVNQSVEVTAPDGDLPIDIIVSSRFDEDGLGGGQTA